ncbi:MAG: LuxR family transcriptional regulator [Gammaproteobacteria bacterium]|nr:LuxR family transcriptional regulator [Gammaproteobacteria bacterium]
MAARKSTKKRPRIEIDLAEVERLASLGLTQEQIAASLGISERTLRNRKESSAEFADAIKAGQAKGISEVANALWTNAMGGNVTAQIFFLKARAKWKDKHEDGAGDDDAPTERVTVTVVDGNADPE